jgi:hypothetical protein
MQFSSSLLVITLLGSLLIPSWATSGQPHPNWSMERRCLVQSDTELDFDGSILFGGWAGVHALGAGDPTTTVRIFSELGWIENSIRFEQNGFSALSPDNRWFVILSGQLLMHCPPCHTGDLIVNELLVYDTTQRGKVIRIPYRGIYQFDVRHDYQPRWINDNQLLFAEAGDFDPGERPAPVLISPFEADFPRQWPTPDLPYLPRISLRPIPETNQALVTPEETSNTGSKQEFTLVNLPSGEVVQVLGQLTWQRGYAISNNGQHLLYASPERADSGDVQVYLLNIESGDRVSIADINELIYFSPYSGYVNWSYDDRYVVFHDTPVGESAFQNQGMLHIVDTETQVVYNTCIVTRSVHWSPNQQQLAIAQPTPDSSQTVIRVIDLTKWEMHTVGFHDGAIIGWVGE